ncbi:tyrosine-type recombinase/integrase [Aerococcus sp. L_32]|uniref:site-specific integrase n=1 Tax=Aerococcus sp. L_32 TaxID=3422316 RepID=UPI003D6C46AD
MASYKQYSTSKGVFWHIRGYLGVDSLTGKQIYANKRGFKTKKEAQHYYNNAKVEFQNEGIKKEPQRMTFEALYQEWLLIYEKDVEQSTLVKTKQVFRTHILPRFGKYYIDKIQVSQVQAAVHEWREILQEYRKVFNKFNRVLKYAYKLKYIKENPCDFVILPSKPLVKQEKETLDFYTKEQLETFMTCLAKMNTRKWEAFFRILAFTGLRRGEALALTWDDIDTNQGLLTVNKAVKRGENGQYVGSTKNESSVRTITIDDNTIKILKAWKAEQAKTLIGFGFNAIQPNQYIFSKWKDNTPLNTMAPRNALVKICKRFDLPMMNIHGFRHTNCSLLFEAGVPMKDVMDRLGHSDIQTTMNVYTHVTKSSRDNSAQMFAKYVDF